MFECAVRKRRVHETQRQHEQSESHKREVQLATFEEAERDKNGVVVSPSDKRAYDLGVTETGQATLDISLKVSDPQFHVILRKVTLSDAMRNRSW